MSDELSKDEIARLVVSSGLSPISSTSVDPEFSTSGTVGMADSFPSPSADISFDFAKYFAHRGTVDLGIGKRILHFSKVNSTEDRLRNQNKTSS